MIELVQGNIVHQEVDAIVNAANRELRVGHGVDGAIHGAGGPAIHEETQIKYPDGCPTGSAVVSNAGKLPAKYVFHAVGPVWFGGDSGEPDQLANAYYRCLELAVEHNCKSIAFPAISCGVYGYPLEDGARIALKTVSDFLKDADLRFGYDLLVRFVLFDREAYNAFDRVQNDLNN